MHELIISSTCSFNLRAMDSSLVISPSVPEVSWLWRMLKIHVALFMITILLSLTVTRVQRSDQPSLEANQVMPLSGQLVQTRSPDVSHSLPVYVSVSLKKLLSVDEIQYRFTADLLFTLVWVDHEALKTILAALLDHEYSDREDEACRKFLSTGDSADGNVTTVEELGNDVAHLEASESSMSVYIDELKTSCEKLAYQLKEKNRNCKRFCNPGDALMCCDSLYLPGFRLANLVNLPLNGPTTDSIGAILPSETISQPFIIRNVEFQGTFSTPLNFRGFPFDRQQLEIDLSVADTVSYIVKSSLLKGEVPDAPSNIGKLEGHEEAVDPIVRSDELAGWKVTSMRWDSSGNTTEGLSSTEYEPFETSDPLGHFFEAVSKWDSDTESPTNLTSCKVKILIKRTFLYHFFTIVFPSMITVFFALLPLLMSPNEMELRFTATVTLFLALVAVQYSNTSSLPKSTYLTNFHYFIIVSYGIMLLIAIGNLIIYFLFRRANDEARIASASRNIEEGHTALMEEAAKTKTQPQTLMISAPVHDMKTPKITKTKSKVRRGYYTVSMSNLFAEHAARRKERMKKLGQLHLHRRVKIVDRLCFLVLILLYLTLTYYIFKRNIFN